MGRRAKNKQSDPSPLAVLEENAERPSQKKLGKRKAEEVEGPTKRPAKKAKDAPAKKGSTKSDARPKPTKTPSKKSKTVAFDEDDEGGGSSEGWEDIDDSKDLKEHAK